MPNTGIPEVDNILAKMQENDLALFRLNLKKETELLNTRRILRVTLQHLSISEEELIRIVGEKMPVSMAKEILSSFEEKTES
jgi:hypothetical protein